MSLTQALNTALAGLNATQSGLSVISGNVANANTPGYVDRTVNQIAVGSGGDFGSSVDIQGINRNLNTLLQSQLWTETSSFSRSTGRPAQPGPSTRHSIVSRPLCNPCRPVRRPIRRAPPRSAPRNN
jgi:hypothetical protein